MARHRRPEAGHRRGMSRSVRGRGLGGGPGRRPDLGQGATCFRGGCPWRLVLLLNRERSGMREKLREEEGRKGERRKRRQARGRWIRLRWSSWAREAAAGVAAAAARWSSGAQHVHGRHDLVNAAAARACKRRVQEARETNGSGMWGPRSGRRWLDGNSGRRRPKQLCPWRGAVYLNEREREQRVEREKQRRETEGGEGQGSCRVVVGVGEALRR